MFAASDHLRFAFKQEICSIEFKKVYFNVKFLSVFVSKGNFKTAVQSGKFSTSAISVGHLSVVAYDAYW